MGDFKVVRRYALDDDDLTLIREQLALTDNINKSIVNVGAVALSQHGTGKEPTEATWAAVKHLEMDIQAFIDDPDGPPCNIGFNNQSGWLDVDIDAPKSASAGFSRAIFAGMYSAGVDLSLAFGRSSVKFPTHAYVRLPEDEAMNLADLLLYVPPPFHMNGERFHVELRSTPPLSNKGGMKKAKQTCVPGSVLPHPSDNTKPDITCWYEGDKIRKVPPKITPAKVSFSQLLAGHALGVLLYAVDKAGVWHEGNRQSVAVVLGGWLARLVIQAERADPRLSANFPIKTDQHAEAAIKACCEFFDDDAVKERMRPFEGAKEKLLNNPEAPLPGWPAMAKLLGAEASAVLRSICLPGAGTNALIEMSEQYVLNDATSMYIDVKRARKGQNYEFMGAALKQRHSDETIEINGKTAKLFPVFEVCGLRKRVDYAAFLPQFDPLSVLRVRRELGEAQLLNDDEPTNELSHVVFNQWRGLPHIPVCDIKYDEAVRSDMTRLLGYLTQDKKDQIDFILKWLAWTLQHPDKKQPTAIVLIGGQGIGKSVFGSALMRAMFGEYAGIANTETMKERFFVAPFVGKLVTFLDEAKFTTNEAEEHYKLLVREILINGEVKRVDAETYDVYSRLILAANKQLTLTTDMTPDRATFICKGYDALYLNLPAVEWPRWVDDQKPFFAQFVQRLRDKKYVGHLLHMLNEIDVTYEEVSTVKSSASMDATYRRASARGVELVARYLVETIGFAEGVIPQARLTAAINDAAEECGTKTSVQAVMRVLEEGTVVRRSEQGHLVAAPRAQQLEGMSARLGYALSDLAGAPGKVKF